MDKLLHMSAKELNRLEVIQRLSEKRMSQKEAARILGLSVRQIKRLYRVYRQKGAVGLVSKHRGRKSNNQLAEDVKKQALNLLKTKYKGFGPTLAHEKLVEKEKLTLSDESVRKLTPALASGASVIEENLWKPRKAKKIVVHQLRERRALANGSRSMVRPTTGLKGEPSRVFCWSSSTMPLASWSSCDL